eukprot:7015586-Prymnesium_polylepis.1
MRKTPRRFLSGPLVIFTRPGDRKQNYDFVNRVGTPLFYPYLLHCGHGAHANTGIVENTGVRA